MVAIKVTIPTKRNLKFEDISTFILTLTLILSFKFGQTQV
jgi:hypothetical protein